MCHQDQGRAEAGTAGKDQVDDLGTGRAIEIAGRLISQQQGWIGDDRTGQGDALLLAAGKLGRVMPHACAKPDRAQPLAGQRGAIAAAKQIEGNGDILQRSHRRYQMERLKDDPDMIAAETGQPVLIKRRVILTGHSNPPVARSL